MPLNITEDKPEIYNEVELIELASRVDSKTTTLNRDYTLAWTDAPLEIFGDKQLSCAELEVEIMSKLDKLINHEILEKIKKKYHVTGELEDEENEEIKRKITEEFLTHKKKKNDYGIIIKDMLVNDVTNKIVFTRSHEGRVLKAAISKGQPQQETETRSDKKAIDALKSVFSKKPKQEEQSE